VNHFDVMKASNKDKRLSGRDLKILICILGRVPLKTMESFISREQIFEDTDIPVNHISKHTKRLSDFGWLKKEGNGGRSSFVKYQITIPECVLLLLPKSDKIQEEKGVQNVDKRGTECGRDKKIKGDRICIKGVQNVDKRGTECGRGKKELHKELHKELQSKRGQKKQFDFLNCPESLLIPVREFVDYRKNKDSKLSQVMVDKIIKKAIQLNLEGFDYQSVVDESIESGWQGLFPKDRHKKIKPIATQSNQPKTFNQIIEERNQDTLNILFAECDMEEQQRNLKELKHA